MLCALAENLQVIKIFKIKMYFYHKTAACGDYCYIHFRKVGSDVVESGNDETKNMKGLTIVECR